MHGKLKIKLESLYFTPECTVTTKTALPVKLKDI